MAPDKSLQRSTLRAFQASADARPVSKPCDLCDADEFKVISRRDRHGKELQTGVCLRCGLIAHLYVPTDAELAEFYARHYRQQYHGETTPSPRRVVRAWRNGERIFRQLTHFVQPGDSVFEVGAGIGCTVKVFQENGCRATGIEPGEGFHQYSKEKLHADLARCDLMELAPQPQHDLVLLVHVIEHVNSPTRALKRIHALLKPGGRLYVECPNLAAPFALPPRMFHYAHIHNFTPRTLAMLAEKCGFTIEARFGGEDDPNLQMLLRRSAETDWQLDLESCACTLRSLSRYNFVTYHLRWNYLWPRCRKLLRYFEEHLFARCYVRQIEARCTATAAPLESDRRQKAA